jgi:hypothetical protein
LNSRHDHAAQLDAAGAKLREISAATRYTIPYLSRLRHENPLYQQRIEHYRQNPPPPPSQPDNRAEITAQLKTNQAMLTILHAELAAELAKTQPEDPPPVTTNAIDTTIVGIGYSSTPSLQIQAADGTSGRPNWVRLQRVRRR